MNGLGPQWTIFGCETGRPKRLKVEGHISNWTVNFDYLDRTLDLSLDYESETIFGAFEKYL